MLESGSVIEEPTYASQRDRWRGAFVLSLALLLSFSITLWAKDQLRLRKSQSTALSVLRGVELWPERVDALKSLNVARKVSQLSSLRGIALDGVKADGTIDLGQAKAAIKYVFQSERQRNVARPTARRPNPSNWACPKQVVKLRHEGLTVEPVHLDASCESNQKDVLPAPRCSPKEVWSRAISKGAPKKATAHLEYYRGVLGPVWKFQIPEAKFNLLLSGDCKRELSSEQASGRVP
jgi:hypothetical protein